MQYILKFTIMCVATSLLFTNKRLTPTMQCTIPLQSFHIAPFIPSFAALELCDQPQKTTPYPILTSPFHSHHSHVFAPPIHSLRPIDIDYTPTYSPTYCQHEHDGSTFGISHCLSGILPVSFSTRRHLQLDWANHISSTSYPHTNTNEAQERRSRSCERYAHTWSIEADRQSHTSSCKPSNVCEVRRCTICGDSNEHCKVQCVSAVAMWFRRGQKRSQRAAEMYN
jgi:hypothetical protein